MRGMLGVLLARMVLTRMLLDVLLDVRLLTRVLFALAVLAVIRLPGGLLTRVGLAGVRLARVLLPIERLTGRVLRLGAEASG